MTEQPNIIRLLTERQLLKVPVNLTDEGQSPWYIKILLALAGWLAALFFFGFFAITLADLVDNIILRTLVGLATISGAFFILKAPQSEFFEHIGLAVSLNGQALIAWALFDYFAFEDKSIWAIALLIQTLLAWYMPSFLHRFFSALAAAYALSVLMAMSALPSLFSSILMLFCAWLWLHEFNIKQLSRTRAIAYGVTLALVTIKASNNAYWLWPEQESAFITQWVDEALNCLVLIYVSWRLLKRYQITIPSALANAVLATTLLLGLISLQASGLAVAMMIIVLAFAASHRVLMGLGMFAGLFYISKYYYSLEFSLSEKSFSLVIVGLTLLALSKTLNWWQKRGASQYE